MDMEGVGHWVALMVAELVASWVEKKVEMMAKKKVDEMVGSLALLLALRWVDVMVECMVD
jgi:hypothetical protein